MFFISETRKRGKEIHKLNNNKASQHFDIPTKIIQNSSDIFSDFLYVSINNSIKSLFLSSLKTADITPIYKKEKKDLKDNYRPISILPVVSKLYERSMFKQISEFFEIYFLKKPKEKKFRKGHSTRQCLLAMVEK